MSVANRGDMVSCFAGVARAPVPLMAAAWIAHASSRLICPEGIYHALAKGFIERASPLPASSEHRADVQ